MRKPFRLPEDMIDKEAKEPVSARVKVSTLETLKKAAGSKLSLSELVSNILDDWANWYKEQK